MASRTARRRKDVRLKRAYQPPSPDDGVRVLVDRLWPRGLRKADAATDLWLKDVAPTNELRRWFAHDPRRWTEFQRRYRAELSHNPAALEKLRELVREGRVTLVYSAHDEARNQAVGLQKVLTR